MAGVLREMERKFSIRSDFPFPEFIQLPGVTTVRKLGTQTLEAVYYDTPDFRLASNGITFRRRVGGHDAGWHVKLPVRAGEREEIQRPLETDPGAPDSPAVLDDRRDRLNQVKPLVDPTPEVSGAATVAAGSRPVRRAVLDGQPTRTPPGDLVDLLFVHLGGAPLRPVARVVTMRTAVRLQDATGADLAEVVDDQVSAQTLGGAKDGELNRWREIEVERVGSGDASVLDKIGAVLTAAGAAASPDSSKLARVLGPALVEQPGATRATPRKLGSRSQAGDVVRAYLVAQVEALIAADPRVRLDVPDAVHKMRVATRRFRSTLRTFAPMFDPELAARMDGELRDLAGALSAARDSEVMVEYFDGRVAALPEDLVRGPVVETIDRHLLSGQAHAREQALAMLCSERYLTLVHDLKSLVGGRGALQGPARKPARIALPKLIGQADRRLVRKVGAALATPSGPDRDVQLHSARRQAKRLRYGAEVAVPVFGSDASAFAKLAEQIQELLGAHQDATVAAGQLREWGMQAAEAGEPTAFTLGLLLGLEECRARIAERDFIDFWPQAVRRRHRRWLA